MKHWNFDEAAAGLLPEAVCKVTMSIHDELVSLGGRSFPRIVGGAYETGEEGILNYTVLVEAVPGLVQPTEYEAEVWEDSFPDAGDEILGYVLEGLIVALKHSDELLGKVGAVRREARAIAAECQVSGLPLRVTAVHLAPYDHWRGSLDPRFEVEFEGLDDRLLPAPTHANVGAPDELRAELEPTIWRLRERCRRRSDLARADADGTIDLLALTSIRRLGNTRATLRTLLAEERIWLEDDTCLSWNDGHVRSYDHQAVDGMTWMDDWVTFENCLVDPKTAAHAVGRPVTEVMDHPLLSASMIVREVRRSVDMGQLATSFCLEMPRLHFCGATGRTWDAPAPSPDEKVVRLRAV